jgi:transposase
MPRPTSREKEVIKKRDKLIVLLCKDGHTQSEVAKYFGLSRPTINIIIKRNEQGTNQQSKTVVK